MHEPARCHSGTRNFLDFAQSVEDAQRMRGLDAMSLGDDDSIRTNPTTPVTVRDYVAAVKPRSLASIPTPEADVIIARAEIRGMEMARRLGVDGKSSRLPAYIWRIIFS